MASATFQNVPLAPMTVGGVREGNTSIFMHVAPGQYMASGTRKRNTSAREITKMRLGEMIEHQKLPQR